MNLWVNAYWYALVLVLVSDLVCITRVPEHVLQPQERELLPSVWRHLPPPPEVQRFSFFFCGSDIWVALISIMLCRMMCFEPRQEAAPPVPLEHPPIHQAISQLRLED